MSKRTKKTKKTTRQKKIAKLEFLIYLIVVAAFFGMLSWLAGRQYENIHPIKGQISVNTPSATDYNQMDLRLAAKAYYSNTPIRKNRVVTATSDYQNIIFDFSVPKDKLTEHGLMSLPAKAPPSGGYPVIILCHGYNNPWSYSTYNAYLGDMDFYTKKGFAVLKPDFRGQGLSIADGSPDGAYYSMSYNTDIMSLIAAVKRTPYLDKNNINLWGHSMGAYIALRAAVLYPSIKNVILLSGPVGTVQDMYSAYTAISDRLNPTASAIKGDELARFGTPYSNPGFWNNTSPLNFLRNSKAHIQIHVGTDDAIVPPEFSAELDQALSKAHKDHEYYVYPGGGHGLISERSLILSRSLAALSKK
jgi:dipeptidyl aminopeptidase/acylaminoacyl peptidase